MAIRKAVFLILLFLISCNYLQSQLITGVWKGKINRQKVELKIIQKGDSLTGTAYYFESANNYRRYSIKGYFDPHTNSAVWWDDQLLEEKSGRLSISTPGKIPLLSTADFNCPGGGKMMLDGKAEKRDDRGRPVGEVNLDKTTNVNFEDEWDFVIDNYTIGGNDPTIIDSIDQLSKAQPVVMPVSEPETIAEPIPAVVKVKEETVPVTKPSPEKKTEPAKPEVKPLAIKVPSIEEKYVSRQKIFATEIPLKGDSIELRFYDNAQIDGDSISLFLNDKLLYQHIRLTGKAYSIKLAVDSLNLTNELTMVAENLGSIPPNTSYMVAIVNGEKFEAFLSSTEGSSAMIRLTKK